MAFVGARPVLFNQYDLISQRDRKEVSQLKPGITGWA
jgi:O-antigen biosynthesis protein WbqP